MLVLSRRKNETIVIGDNIEVTLLDVRGDRVRLGIVAPPEVRVMRQELLRAGDAASDDDSVIALADDPRREDTLSSGTARNSGRNHKHCVRRPR